MPTSGSGSASGVISNTIQDALRLILADPDATTYSNERLDESLRLNREQVFYCDPYALATGNIGAFLHRTHTRVPPSDIDYSLLHSEPGGLSFQAIPAVRYWDSSATAQIWVDGEEQAAADYTINYLDGRVTFDTALHDWQAVNASFCYYKILHAARQCLVSQNAAGGSVVRLKMGPVEREYAGAKEALAALDALIRDMQPRTIYVARKIY